MKEGRWRKAMAFAFMLVLGARRDVGSCEVRHIARAEPSAKVEFARWFMLPMLAPNSHQTVARISGQNRIH